MKTLSQVLLSLQSGETVSFRKDTDAKALHIKLKKMVDGVPWGTERMVSLRAVEDANIDIVSETLELAIVGLRRTCGT